MLLHSSIQTLNSKLAVNVTHLASHIWTAPHLYCSSLALYCLTCSLSSGVTSLDAFRSYGRQEGFRVQGGAGGSGKPGGKAEGQRTILDNCISAKVPDAHSPLGCWGPQLSYLVVTPHWRTRMSRRPPLAGGGNSILALLVDLRGG